MRVGARTSRTQVLPSDRVEGRGGLFERIGGSDGLGPCVAQRVQRPPSRCPHGNWSVCSQGLALGKTSGPGSWLNPQLGPKKMLRT